MRRWRLLHDLGRVAVATGIWERPGPLRPHEWELVRMHPYQSGRILARSPLLAPLASAVARHHERVDGSGHPAAAAEVLAGLPLDREAIRAVLDAAGAPRPAMPPLPADLRQVRVDPVRAGDVRDAARSRGRKDRLNDRRSRRSGVLRLPPCARGSRPSPTATSTRSPSGLHPDATWHHRNDDRLGGIHEGREGITAFLGESAQLTGGTLRAVPEAIMADGDGRVAVLVRISGRRADGRTFDVPQILLCAVDGDRVRAIDQFIGDPPAVTAFWA